MNKETKIFIACHKEFTPPQNQIYFPIQVGAFDKQHFTDIVDCSGNNISDKNPSFCELTALYWIWKNVKCDITGLVHYRRYFFSKNSRDMNDILNQQQIEKLLSGHQMIVPPADRLIRYKSVKDSWNNIHKPDDWQTLKQTVNDLYPDYLSAFEKLESSNKFYICNMFICNKDLIDKYCQWLFDILFEIEKRIDTSNYDSYNKRIFGFMSERLFNVWLIKNNIDTVEVPVFNVDKQLFPQIAIGKVKSVLK